MSFADLHQEYERERIGAVILERTRRLVLGTARRYPAKVYAETGDRWNEDAIEGLLQDFVVASLLGAGQLDYTMSLATSLEEFDRMTAAQLARHLRSRRRRTVVDTLVDRARRLLDKPPFVPAATAQSFKLADASVEARPPSDREIAAGVRQAALVPREVSIARERAPRVYSDDDLRRLLVGVARTLPVPLDLTTVRKILTTLLTELAPSELQELQGEGPTPSPMISTELRPDSHAAVAEAVSHVRASLDGQARMVLALKWVGWSDTEAARAIGVSRPTLADRKAQALAVVGDALRDLDDAEEAAAVEGIGRWLSDIGALPREGHDG